MWVTLLHEEISGGVTLDQVLPSSCVRWIKPSSVPVQICRDAGIFARKVGTDFMPRTAAVGRAKEKIRTEVQNAWINRRKNQGKRPGLAEAAGLRQRWRHHLNFFVTEILASDGAAVSYAAIQRIGRDVAIFAAGLDRTPIMKIEGAVIAAAWRGYGVAVLLCAVNPVRKSVIGVDVIKLAGRLVKPGTPGFAGVARDNSALIATHDHALWLIGINPQFVIVVAAGSTFPGIESNAAVG